MKSTSQTLTVMVLIGLNSLNELFILDDDGIVPDEHLLNRHTLQELNTETAKLRNLGATEMIPAEKLVRLLNILEINIRGGDRVSPITDVSDFLIYNNNSPTFCNLLIQ